MKIEQQLAKLAELGLRLNEGVTIDDLTNSFPREEYEQRPFDLILFTFGADVECGPRGRAVCSRAWNFDTECIVETGDYARIVKRLCEVAGRPNALTNVSDLVDTDAGTAWLKYTVNGIERYWPVEINDDWADMETLSHVMEDLERDGHRFFFKDNGQAMVLFYLNPTQAAELNKLSKGALQPALSE